MFPGETYVPIASLTTTVPVLACGGLTKRFLVPGWRMGWIVIYDRGHVFDQEVRKGLLCMSQRIIGSNTLVQGALPTILANTPKSFFDDTISVIQSNAKLAFRMLRGIPGLMPVMPQGAMYMMVKIDRGRFPGFGSDLQFVEQLVAEQSVFCLPGKCFNYPNYIRYGRGQWRTAPDPPRHQDRLDRASRAAEGGLRQDDGVLLPSSCLPAPKSSGEFRLLETCIRN